MSTEYEWSYNPAKDLDKSVIDRLKGFPREPDLTVYFFRSVATLLIRSYLKIFHRIKYVGRDSLPEKESFILVANHSSHLDALSLISLLPLNKIHRTFPAAAHDYFFKSLHRVLFSSIVVNALPFHRKMKYHQSLALCRQLLENPGNVLILFPEGTRSSDGEMKDFKAGIGLLLAETNIPVYPCYIEGAYKAWPRQNSFPRPRKVRLIIGASCQYSEKKRGKESAQFISKDLKKRVSELKKNLDQRGEK